jgi:hypothetical protein
MTYILDRYKTTVKKNITLRRNSKGMVTSRGSQGIVDSERTEKGSGEVSGTGVAPYLA